MRVTLKLATTLDGRIATRTGESQWITSSEARQRVHELRAGHDGVLVGIGTLLADNPQLNVRSEPIPERQPHRIVLDTNLRTPADARIFDVVSGQVYILSGPGPSEQRVQKLESAGAIVLPCRLDGGRVSVSDALEKLGDAGVHSVFVEGGGQVAAAFLRARCVDRLDWFRAPIIIGGDGVPALGSLDVDLLSAAFRFNRQGVRMVGPDIWETYEMENS